MKATGVSPAAVVGGKVIGPALLGRAAAISATVHVHGGFWAFKGQADRLGVESVTADVHQQRITMKPFGLGLILEFNAGLDWVRITGSGGEVKDELITPRRSMAGYTGDTRWSAT